MFKASWHAAWKKFSCKLQICLLVHRYACKLFFYCNIRRDKENQGGLNPGPIWRQTGKPSCKFVICLSSPGEGWPLFNDVTAAGSRRRNGGTSAPCTCARWRRRTHSLTAWICLSLPGEGLPLFSDVTAAGSRRRNGGTSARCTCAPWRRRTRSSTAWWWRRGSRRLASSLSMKFTCWVRQNSFLLVLKMYFLFGEKSGVIVSVSRLFGGSRPKN